MLNLQEALQIAMDRWRFGIEEPDPGQPEQFDSEMITNLIRKVMLDLLLQVSLCIVVMYRSISGSNGRQCMSMQTWVTAFTILSIWQVFYMWRVYGTQWARFSDRTKLRFVKLNSQIYGTFSLITGVPMIFFHVECFGYGNALPTLVMIVTHLMIAMTCIHLPFFELFSVTLPPPANPALAADARQ